MREVATTNYFLRKTIRFQFSINYYRIASSSYFAKGSWFWVVWNKNSWVLNSILSYLYIAKWDLATKMN